MLKNKRCPNDTSIFKQQANDFKDKNSKLNTNVKAPTTAIASTRTNDAPSITACPFNF